MCPHPGPSQAHHASWLTDCKSRGVFSHSCTAQPGICCPSAGPQLPPCPCRAWIRQFSEPSHTSQVLYFIKCLDLAIDFPGQDSNLSCYVYSGTACNSYPYGHGEHYQCLAMIHFPTQHKPFQGLWHKLSPHTPRFVNVTRRLKSATPTAKADTRTKPETCS